MPKARVMPASSRIPIALGLLLRHGEQEQKASLAANTLVHRVKASFAPNACSETSVTCCGCAGIHRTLLSQPSCSSYSCRARPSRQDGKANRHVIIAKLGIRKAHHLEPTGVSHDVLRTSAGIHATDDIRQALVLLLPPVWLWLSPFHSQNTSARPL